MKSPYEMTHVGSVVAWALLWKGKHAGNMIAELGSAVTAQLWAWEGPLKKLPKILGRATGYGYDKFSAAVADGIVKILQGKPGSEYDTREFGPLSEKEREALAAAARAVDGTGASSVVAWLRSMGYQVAEVIS